MGSDSDLPTMQPAVQVLEQFGVVVEVRVLSAHRTPLEMVEFAQMARGRGFKVIGVPVQSRALSGVDSLHSIVQMPAGIPVATVAIGNGLNAGLLAAQILATADPRLAQEISDYRDGLHGQVTAKDTRLQQLGSRAYLEQMG